MDVKRTHCTATLGPQLSTSSLLKVGALQHFVSDEIPVFASPNVHAMFSKVENAPSSRKSSGKAGTTAAGAGAGAGKIR